MAAYDPNQQAFKSKLLAKAGLGEQIVADYGPNIHMVKLGAGPGRRHRLLMLDGGWIEFDPESRKVVIWGSRGLADDLGRRLEIEHFSIQRLEKSGASRKPGAPPRRPRPLTEAQATSLADCWRQLGYDNIDEEESGCWVTLPDGTRFYDSGDAVTIHGPISDAAITAMVAHTKLAWDGCHRLTGPWTTDQIERVWLEGMRQGVELCDYTPPPALIAKWEAEQSAASGAATPLRPGVGPVTSAAAVPTVSGVAAASDGGEPDRRAADRHAKQLAEIDRELTQLHSLWRTHLNDSDRIERARHQIERLEERRRVLLGQGDRLHDGGEYESSYSGPR